MAGPSRARHHASVADLLQRIDAFCDAVPRAGATVQDVGPLRLFVRDGSGWPFYARPVPGGPSITSDDVVRMRRRQVELAVPAAFEWVDGAAPSMRYAVEGAGLAALVCPVLVLDGEPAEMALPAGHELRLLGPLDADLAAAEHAVRSVAAEAFGAGGAGAPTARELDRLRSDLAGGSVARALVVGPDGPVASGAAQRCGDVVELVGIATAARARGRGLGSAVTAALAAAARRTGAGVVFLAAGDETATRVYRRVGFRPVGTCGVAAPAEP